MSSRYRDGGHLAGIPPPDPPPGAVAGLVLAAGAGRRMGGPKALLHDHQGVPWVRTRAQTLLDAGCTPVHVAVGAEAVMVRDTLPPRVGAVVVSDWHEGVGASLGAGLRSFASIGPELQAVMVVVVDTPGLSVVAIRAVLDAVVEAAGGQPLHDALAQATYDGVPGHPVLIGRNHWIGVIDSAVGDQGARLYLSSRRVRRIEIGDIADGTDVDTMEDFTQHQRQAPLGRLPPARPPQPRRHPRS